MTKRKLAAFAALAASLSATPAGAQDVYKIGISAGLTGYAATMDRGWRDGVEVAAAALNAKGGIMGRKIEVVTEDNRSEPQEAVTVYRKMISSDKADIFLSGCVSAGNFAGAPLTVSRADPDGAVLDPAAAARAREMGVQHLAAGRFRGVDAPRSISRKKPRSRRSACCTIRRPMRFCRRTSPRRPRPTTASRSPASSNTSRTMPISACRSARCMRPAPARSSKSASAAPR